FAIPNFSLGFSLRVIRFAYIFLGALAGFLGIALGMYIHGLMYVSAGSFGVPFTAPFAPVMSTPVKDTLTRPPVWQQEKRPDYLNTKDNSKQPHISREWIKRDEEDSGEE
ncbi:MAG TPA: spore germination protein, partial [Clostridiaceae bacterium]|nr:spore germination protein [Clostridiaceae bacterium]